MTEKQTDEPERYAQKPQQSPTFESREPNGKAAKENQQKKSPKESAGRTDQPVKSALQVGKDGNADRTEKQIKSDRTKPQFPAQQKSAKSNGEGLQGHGNAEKLKRKREHGENGNDRRKESGKRDLKRAGM